MKFPSRSVVRDTLLDYHDDMSSLQKQIVNREIENLLSMGWTDIPKDEFGVRVAGKVSISDISFPHRAYDDCADNSESSGIWARWRVRRILKSMRENGHDLLWEVGSGDGKVANLLHAEGVGVIGIEPLISGAVITAQHGVRTYSGTLESLNLPSNSISAVGVFDVIEHIKDPKSLLLEIFRVLKPNGTLLITVPAHQWLFSDFDASIGHYRRYSKRLLFKALENAGFRVFKAEFLFSSFVIPAIFLRKLPSLLGRSRDSRQTRASADRQSKLIEIFTPIIIAILRLEEVIKPPFGLSLFCMSKK